MLCADLFRAIWNDLGTQRNGRSGQRQHGVDVFGRPNGGHEYAGVQVKNKEVSIDELRQEVAKARGFFPALSVFFLATTAPNDSTLQEEARRLTHANNADGSFRVEVWSWDEIQSRLTEHPQVLANHYPQFAIAQTEPEHNAGLSHQPTFSLDFQLAPEGWVHLKVTNFTEAGDFFCDIVQVVGAREEQTTPYLAKWRGDNVEKKLIVREALVDLAQTLSYPSRDINSEPSGVFFIRSHGHTANGWESGYWRLFSQEQPAGWIVEAADYQSEDSTLPPHVRLYFVEIRLDVRVIRLSTNEERAWSVTLGFPPPLKDEQGRWLLPSDVVYSQRVIIDAC